MPIRHSARRSAPDRRLHRSITVRPLARSGPERHRRTAAVWTALGRQIPTLTAFVMGQVGQQER